MPMAFVQLGMRHFPTLSMKCTLLECCLLHRRHINCQVHLKSNVFLVLSVPNSGASQFDSYPSLTDKHHIEQLQSSAELALFLVLQPARLHLAALMVQLCAHGKECCNASYKSKPNSRYKKCQGEKCGKPGCTGCKLEAIHLTAAARTCMLCGRRICCDGCMTKCPHKGMALQGDTLEGQLAALAGVAAVAGSSSQAAPVQQGGPQAMLRHSLQRINNIEASQQAILSRISTLEESVTIFTHTINMSLALLPTQPGGQAAPLAALGQLLTSQMIAAAAGRGGPSGSGAEASLQSHVSHMQALMQPFMTGASGHDAVVELLQQQVALQQHMQQQQQDDSAAAGSGVAAQRQPGPPRDVPVGHQGAEPPEPALHAQGMEGLVQCEQESAAATATAMSMAAAAAAAVASDPQGDAMVSQALHALMVARSLKGDADTQPAYAQPGALGQVHGEQQTTQVQQHGTQEAAVLLPILPLDGAQQQQHQGQGQNHDRAAGSMLESSG